MKLRLAALGSLCVMMGACTHASDSASLEQSVPSKNQRMMALAPDQGQARYGRPIAVVPGEQAVSVREHRYVNGLRQDILLKGGALRGVQNGLTILAHTSRQETLDEQVPLVRPSESGIRSEIGSVFPHLDMQIAERESSNAYGPYGLALGRAGGDVRCAYMWQWIDENRMPAEAAPAGPLSIRVRLCRAGVTFDEMASEMDHLAIGGEQVAGLEPPGVIGAAAAREPVAHAREPREIRRVASHHVRRPANLERREEIVSAPAGAVSGSRYMGTMPAAPNYQQAAAAPVAPKFAGDLPAQAYLGPGGSTSAAPVVAAAKYY